MKVVTALKSIAIAAIAAMSFQNAAAQSPDKMFGVGVTTSISFNGSGAGIAGAELCYALSPGMQIGVGLGIDLASRSRNGSSTSSNSILFAPYGRFILKGTKDFKPFFMGQFIVASGLLANRNGLDETSTALDLGGGGFYFPSTTFGLYGQLSVVTLGFGTISSSDIGIHSGRLGAIWYFN